MAKKKFIDIEDSLGVDPPASNKVSDKLVSIEDTLPADLLSETEEGLERGLSINNADEFFRLSGQDWNPEEGTDLTAVLATNQSFGEQLNNMFKGSIPTFASGFLSGLNYDVPDMVDMLAGKEKEYGNWLTELADDLREKGEEYPIYQDGDSFSDPAYWLNQAKNLSFSVGLITESLIEQAALSALSTATLGAVAPAQAASLGIKGKLLGNFAFGSVKGIQEGYINGMETFNSTKNKYLELGYSEKQADKFASEAASLAYRSEIGPLMLLNGLQFATIGKYNPFAKSGSSLNQGFSGAIEGLTDIAFKNVKNRFLKGGISYGVNALSEGVEEGIQTGISAFAQHEVLTKSQDVFTDFELWDHEMRDSVIGGVLGGLLFSGFGNIMSKVGARQDKKELGRIHDGFIQSLGTRTARDLKGLEEAFESGDQLQIDTARYKMQKNNVFQALKLDYINQKETAFDSYIAELKKVSDAVKNKDVKTLTEMGLTNSEDISYIQENYDKFISDAVSIKKKFIKNEARLQDFNIAATLTDRQQALEHAIEYENRSKQQVETLKNDSSLYGNLSQEGKEIFDIMIEKSALEEKAKTVGITNEQKTRIAELNKQLNEADKGQQWGKDKNILKSIEASEFIGEMMAQHQMQDLQNAASEEIKRWNNPRTIEKVKRQRAKEAARTAKTAQDVQTAKEQLQSNGDLDRASEEALNAKEKELQISTPRQPDEPVQEASKVDPRKAKAQISISSIIQSAANIDPNDLHHAPADITLSEKAKAELKNTTARIYEMLSTELGRAPSFKEFVEDFSPRLPLEKLDQLYNGFIEGWKLNGYADTNFGEVYNEIFLNREKQQDDLVSLIESSITNKEDLIKANEDILEGTVKEDSPVVTLDENNRPQLVDQNPYKTSVPGLKAAFLSLSFIRKLVKNDDGTITVQETDTSTELNTSEHLQHQNLLDPDKYNPGAELDVRIPDDYENIRVSTWRNGYEKGPSMTFRQWANQNGIVEGSQEWIEKVPMIAYDGDTPLFFVHDNEWYNFVNVGLKDNEIEQSKVIVEARKNLSAFRENVYTKKGTKIKITEKRGGTWKKIEDNEPAITLNQANPDSTLAIMGDTDLKVSTTERFLEGDNTLRNDLESNPLEPGHIYDIRKGVRENEYVALEVLREKISEDVVTTLKWATRAYLYREDKSNSPMAQKAKQIRDQILNLTKGGRSIDIFDVGDFDYFMKMFVPYVRGDVRSRKDVVPAINANEKIENGTPFLVTQNNSLIFGIKGQKISGKEDILYIHPARVNDPGGAAQVEAMLRKFDQLLPNITQNASLAALSANDKMISIDQEGNVVPLDKDYQTFLKDSFKTSVRSFNVGTKENPVYATYIQPSIHFEEVFEENPIKEIAKKEKENKPLTPKQESQRVDVVEQVELENTPITTDVQDLMNEVEEFLAQNGITDTDVHYSPPILTEEQVKRIEENTTGIGGLDIIEEFQLVDYVFNTVTSRIDFKHKSSTDKRTLMREVRDSYRALVEPKKKKSTELLTRLSMIEGVQDRKISSLISQLERVLDKVNIVESNWKTIESNAIEKIEKYTGIKQVQAKEEVTELEDGISEKEKNYSKESFEENGKSTASYRLRRFMAGVKEVNPDGTLKQGVLGIPVYLGYDQVYNVVEQIMASPYEMDSDFDLMLTRLKENIEVFPWLQQIIDQFEKGEVEERIKNEFVYNFSRHTLSMKFVIYSKDRNGNWRLKVHDTNSNEVTLTIRKQWDSNLKSTNNILTYNDNGKMKINKERAKYLHEKFLDLQKRVKARQEIPNIELQEWLNDFGIYLSDDTLNELKSRKTTFMTNQGQTSLQFHEMFRDSASTAGIFGLLGNYVKTIQHKENTEFQDNPENHPFNNAGSTLKRLARMESKYSTYTTTNSFRDGKKSIYGFTLTKGATDSVKKLKFDENHRNQILSTAFGRQSLLLNLLNGSEAVRDKLGINHLGITSLKQQGKKVFGDNSITSLSEADNELVRLGMFQDTHQGSINERVANGDIGMRMAKMLFPTMSDKSQMLTLNTPVLEIEKKHLEDDLSGPKEALLNLIYSQVVEPELQRIIEFNSKIKSTDIKGYDFGAQLFLMIPELNNMTAFSEETGQEERVVALMALNPEKYNLDEFNRTFRTRALEIIKSVLTTEVQSKLDLWNENFVVDDRLQFIDADYLKRFPGNRDEKLRMAAFDFVINTFVSQANMYMTIAGDPAMYMTGKAKKYFQDGKPWLPKQEYGDSAYHKMMKEVVGVNIGKRLALLLAPGNKLANSKGQKYTQITINDFVDVTSNVRTLVDLFYGKEEGAIAKAYVDDYNKSTDTVKRKAIAERLSNQYPEIADYFDIEATDAQEYTTLSEHINVLRGQGRLSDEQYQEITEKIENQKKAEQEGKRISKKDLLNHAELKLVLQPLKPVHNGMMKDNKSNSMRVVYVKSSSFPLIPQLTKGTEMDGLRRLLEDYETKGKPVRASYQTANKVGSSSNPITAFNPDGTFNSDLTVADLEAAAIELDRDNFRIQQDVPFKSSSVSQDKVSIGTQTLKLLFGNGINKLEGMEKLHQEFNDVFNNLISLKRKRLFNELGLDNNGQPVDIKKSMRKLEKMLIKEAKGRGYPRQDIEALKLTPVLNAANEVVDLEFNIPLWMSSNTNRYEALLNAIVSNRLVNIKIPGSSYVVGSETGFKTKSDFSGINQNNIIYTSKWQGELKAFENKDGKVQKAQVLVPSKFRDNQGNLIELIDKNGNPNPLYAERNEQGVLMLKEDKIDPELLSITSFRIPTSSHVSMSQLEIVGILPTEVGDLMIVPRNLTKQKGLDFDIDKETTYQRNTFVDEEGNIRVLKEENRQELLKQIDKKRTDYLNDNSAEGNLINALFGDADFTKEDLADDQFLTDQDDKISEKLLENRFVQIHDEVLSSSDPEVQKKINKVLSMDFARGQADLIQEAVEDQVDSRTFTILSDTYQKDKMALGSSGKLGIGVYSNYVVFHSMIQQSPQKIQLKQYIYDEEGKRRTIPLKVQLGSQTSYGVLGEINTLAPGTAKRNIAEVFAERQNTATDNEKEQIMGRVNVNEVTINVDSLLSALGFDKDTLQDGRQVSLPYLFLSQPIIREYVKEVRKTKSNLTPYDPLAKEKTIAKLKEQYSVENYDSDRASSMLTGQELFNNVSGNVNNTVQLRVLETFIQLDDYARTLSKLQNRLNINRSGLGKSFFDTIDKYNAVEDIQADYDRNSAGTVVANASSLVGDYVKLEDLSPAMEEELIRDGYVKFENFLIRPNNPVSSMLVNATQVGYNLWSDHFPYGNEAFTKVTKRILNEISGEGTSDQKKIELMQGVFKDFKKFLLSSSQLGTYSGNIQAERARLFVDTEDNKSLASYLFDIKYTEEAGQGISVVRRNKLLSRFFSDLKKDGTASIIRFDNSRGENFDEDYLYNSLIELMSQNLPLPSYNGEEYSTRALAQDLITYSFLEGGIQEAIQFSKYIPVSILNELPFAEISREWNRNPNSNVWSNTTMNNFYEQYIRHNPGRLFKIDPTKQLDEVNFTGETQELGNLIEFTIDPAQFSEDQFAELSDKEYVAIYNENIKRGLKKFQIYKQDNGRFYRVSNLGVQLGMSEYAADQQDVKSIVNDNFRKTKLEDSKVEQEQSPKIDDPLGVDNSTVTEVLEAIPESSSVSTLAKALIPFIPAGLKIGMVNFNSVKWIKEKSSAGLYTQSSNEIWINSSIYPRMTTRQKEMVVLHEVVHGLTANYMENYIDDNGKFKKDVVIPREVTQMMLLYNEAKKEIIGKFGSKHRFFYYVQNIHEFMAGALTDYQFQAHLDTSLYRESGQSMMTKLARLVDSILKRMLGSNYKENGLTFATTRSVLEVVKAQYISQKQDTAFDQMRSTDQQAESLLNTETDMLNDLYSPNITTTFDQIKENLNKKDC